MPFNSTAMSCWPIADDLTYNTLEIPTHHSEEISAFEMATFFRGSQYMLTLYFHYVDEWFHPVIGNNYVAFILQDFLQQDTIASIKLTCSASSSFYSPPLVSYHPWNHSMNFSCKSKVNGKVSIWMPVFAIREYSIYVIIHFSRCI